MSNFRGKLITANEVETTGTSASGFWNLTEQAVRSYKLKWPSAFLLNQIGTTTYSATGVGPVNDINEIATALNAAGIYASMPNSGYLKYILKTGVSSTKIITVSYEKVDADTATPKFSQSAFSLFGQTFSYPGSVISILFYSNDDHDTLYMDADGKGIIARTNINSLTTSTLVDKFQAGASVLENQTLTNVVVYQPGTLSTANTFIAFPKTGAGVWIDAVNGRYKLNNFTETTFTMPGGNLSSTPNNLYTISDGVNKFIIGGHNRTAYAIGTLDLQTGVITFEQRNWTSSVPTATAVNTEEDAIGNQLFTIDNRTSYHDTTLLYYGGTYNWLTTNPSGVWWNNFGVSTATIGASTQTGMDVWGSIDTDGYVWFADWGHDDGGLFSVGNDSQLGTRKTNIRMIPDDYTN